MAKEKQPAEGFTPDDDPILPLKKARKKAVRTPTSDVMRIAGQIDRLLNKLPDENLRRRVLAVVMASQATLPLGPG